MSRPPFSSPSDVRLVIKPRAVYSHKGDYGSLLLVGGSDVYSGAPALAGMAGLRTGAGLVFIAAPKRTAPTIRSYSPDLIVHQLGEEVITPNDVQRIAELLARSDALVLGPGMGRAPETQAAIPQILEMATKMKKPALVDADAIRAVAGTDAFKHHNIILTPHAGEFKALSGIEAPLTWHERLSLCVEFARKNSCILLLKGHDTIITDGTRAKVNRTGNPGMATGGMGDVLSGIIGAFLAQGAEPYLAAVASAYVHGRAGDRVAKEKGFHMVASDLIDMLPAVLREFDRTTSVRTSRTGS